MNCGGWQGPVLYHSTDCIMPSQGQLFKTTGDLSISLAQGGLYGKACQALVSSGVAPNSEETWKLLFTKHHKCEHPITPTAPEC